MIGFHSHSEGGVLRNGFNIYRGTRRSRGFVFKAGRTVLRCRWSGFRRCWFVSLEISYNTPRERKLFGFTWPKPAHRFEAERDWMLQNTVKVERIDAS